MSGVEVPAGVDLGDVELTAGLHTTDKTVLASGVWRGRPVVVKIRTSQERFWRERFEHECGMYRGFAEKPPPVRVPQLRATDGHRFLVLERLPGQQVARGRYPSQPLAETVLDQVLNMLDTFGQWQPPCSMLPPALDYTCRPARYAAGGWFSSADRDKLESLLAAAGPPTCCQHGDPLLSNLLLTPDGCALVDFEHTARFVRGWDVALLHTVLAGQPDAQRRVARYVSNTSLAESAWLLNRALVLRGHLISVDGGMSGLMVALA